MSSDPNAPVNPQNESGGYVVRNMIYQHTAGGGIEVMTGWNDGSTREYNQEIVPPADRDLHPKHPCIDLNTVLLKCSLACEPKARLTARIVQCNEERKAMMQCMTKNKKWKAPKDDAAWYKFW